MSFTVAQSLTPSRFTEFFVSANGLGRGGFKEWVFCSGMLFRSSRKWWADEGERDRPHEGVDLCLYRDGANTLCRLDDTTNVPAMYDGVVARIIPDFLGKSAILAHGAHSGRIDRLFSIYGHINPGHDLVAGSSLRAGDILGTVARPARSKAALLPHLHITLGWMPENAFNGELDWETISTSPAITFLDPLHVFDRRHVTSRPPFQRCRDLLNRLTPGP